MSRRLAAFEGGGNHTRVSESESRTQTMGKRQGGAGYGRSSSRILQRIQPPPHAMQCEWAQPEALSCLEFEIYDGGVFAAQSPQL